MYIIRPAGSRFKVSALWKQSVSVEQVVRERSDALTEAASNAAAITKRNKRIELLREQCIRLHQIKPETDVERRWAAEGPHSNRRFDVE